MIQAEKDVDTVARSLNPTVERSFHAGCADVKPTRKLIGYPGTEPLHVTVDVGALPLAAVARELAGALLAAG